MVEFVKKMLVIDTRAWVVHDISTWEISKKDETLQIERTVHVSNKKKNNCNFISRSHLLFYSFENTHINSVVCFERTTYES